MATPNDLLRRARLGILSPSGLGRRLSRAEHDKAVNTWAGGHHRIDTNSVGRLERRPLRPPNVVRGRALSDVLPAVSDVQLGLTPRTHDDDAYIDTRASEGSLCIPLRPAAVPAAGSSLVDVVNLPVGYTVEDTESGGVRLVAQTEHAQAATLGVAGGDKST